MWDRVVQYKDLLPGRANPPRHSQHQSVLPLPVNTGAFGFIAGGYFLLAIAMVFGSIASSSSWEPFCRAIEALPAVYANRPDLVAKHKKYLDMIHWADTNPLVELTKAVACSINQGVLDDQGVARPRLERIFVDNSLLLAIGQLLTKMALAALIKAIFVVMGEPDTAIRQCPRAQDNWIEMVAGPVNTMLGLILDTNRLTVTIPSSYVNNVWAIINTTRHKNRRKFIVGEAQTLTGKLGHLAEGARPLGSPPHDPPLRLHRTLPSREQTSPDRIVTRIL